MKPLIGLLGVLLAAFAAEFNDQVSSIAMADVLGGLGISHDPGTWIASLYVTAEILGMTLSPWLLVTFTLRHFTLYVLLVNVTSSVLIPYSPAVSALYALRIVQGLSGGLTIPLLMTTALRVLPPPIRLYGLAVYALTASFTPALSASMAALWTDAVGWQFVFLEVIPFCAASSVLVWYGLPQDPPVYQRLRAFDWRGALGVLIGFGSLSTMLQQGDRLDWFNSSLICMLGMLSVIAVPLLLLNEWHHPLPLLKLQLLGRRNMAYGVITLFAFIIVSQSSSTIPNTFLQQVQAYRPEQFYLITLLIALPQLVLLPATALLLDHEWVDARLVSFVGLALVLASCVGSSLVTIDWKIGQFFLWQGLQAVGQPLVVMPLLMMATNTVKGPEEAPFASALVNTPRALGEAAGIWLIQLIDRWRGGLHYNRIDDQTGLDRWRLIQAPQILPQHPSPLPPGAGTASPGSLSALQEMIQVQARILTVSDEYLIVGAIAVVLIVVLLILPVRTLPPRLQFAKK